MVVASASCQTLPLKAYALSSPSTPHPTQIKFHSSSEESDSEKEPVTSTVPELETEAIPDDLKSERSSWLYRRSRTPSPPAGGGERRKQRVVTTRQTTASRNPHVINRKNEVKQ